MIYKPQRNPKPTLILIFIIVLIGIFGGFYVSKWFTVFALAFWAHFTAVLAFLQIKRKSKHGYKSITETLLHPVIRFILFEFLAVFGIVGVLVYEYIFLPNFILILWLGFAVNFYIFYRIKQIPE